MPGPWLVVLRLGVCHANTKLLRVESALEASLMGRCWQTLGTSAPSCLGEPARVRQSWPSSYLLLCSAPSD